MIQGAKIFIRLTARAISLRLPRRTMARTFNVLLRNYQRITCTITNFDLHHAFVGDLFNSLRGLPCFLNGLSSNRHVHQVAGGPLRGHATVSQGSITLLRSTFQK